MEAVRGWVRAVVHGGNWRFGDPSAVQQDVLIELVRITRGPSVQEPGSFLKLARSVAKNVCVDAYHRERRRAAHEVPESESAPEPIQNPIDPEERTRARERTSSLSYVLQRLPGSCRELWTLVYGERLASGAIAERLGTTDGNIRVRMHRCLERARSIYHEYEARSVL